jgi:carbon monoxide dehydrogenase subunit G
MVEIRGEESFERAAEQIWGTLTRPEFLCGCFPGVDRVVRTDERSAELIVRPGFSFVRGTITVTFEFVELKPHEIARVLIHIKAIGSSAELESMIVLHGEAGSTRVEWTAKTLQLGGLLKAVSQGLLKAAAQKVASDTWAEIRKGLASGAA